MTVKLLLIFWFTKIVNQNINSNFIVNYIATIFWFITIFIFVKRKILNKNLQKINLMSNVKNQQNRPYKICSEQLKDCYQAKTYCQILPSCCKTNTALREYVKNEISYSMTWRFSPQRIIFKQKLLMSIYTEILKTTTD